MKNFWKRSTAFVLAVFLIATMIPSQSLVWAAEGADQTSSSVVVVDGTQVQGTEPETESSEAVESGDKQANGQPQTGSSSESVSGSTQQQADSQLPSQTTKPTQEGDSGADGEISNQTNAPQVNALSSTEAGWKVIDGSTYYVMEDGGYATGKVQIEDKWYGFDASGIKIESGWFADGQNWCWAKADANGALACDEVYRLSDKTLAVFDQNCNQVTGGWYTAADGNTYYQDLSTGYRVATGKKTIGDKLYLFDSNGALLPKEDWYTASDGKKYYVQKDGSLATGKVQVDGIWYGFGADGVKAESGWFADGPNWCWAKADANGALASNEAYHLSDNTTAVFDEDCNQVTDGWHTAANGKTYYQDQSTGYRVATGKKMIDGELCVFGSDGVLQSRGSKGWQIIDGKTYYVKEDGKNATGKVEIDGVWYGFGADGVKVESGWFADGPNWCWAKADANGALACDEVYRLSDKTLAVFDQNCNQVTGGWYTAADGNTYYQDLSTGYRVATGKKMIDGELCVFGSDGVLQSRGSKGWQVIDGKTYYVKENGQAATGKEQIEGVWYGFSADGVKVESGWFADGANWCWAKADANGALACDEVYRLSDKTLAVFDENCNQVTGGWHTAANGKTYYQDQSTGYRVATGKKMIDGELCVFGSDGVLQSKGGKGWQTVDGKTYYILESGSAATGKVEIDGVWYGFGADGVKVESGWFADGANWCWAKADANGALACDEAYHLSDNTIAVFDENCNQVTGGWYATAGGEIYYQNQSTGYRVATGKKMIDGVNYVFSSEGVLTDGRPPIGEPGWQVVGNKTYYLQQNGKYATGKVEIDGVWYGFGADGVKVESGWFADGSNWCWAKADANGALACDETYLLSDNTIAVFDENCNQVTGGWHTAANGKTYYQDQSTGYRVATGKKMIDGVNYVFSSEGVLTDGRPPIGEPGWQVVGNKTYYLQQNGKYATGKVEIDGVWYGFGADGVKVESGWFADGSNWCWAKADANGALACDETYLLSDNTIAVFDENCNQVTGGWHTAANGKTYYQDQSTGYRIATGKKTISSKLYLFDSNGVLLPKGAWYTASDGKTYYVQNDGSLATGKVEIGAVWYGFGTDGVKVESGWFADGSNWCWAKEDANGALACDEAYRLSDKTIAVFDKNCYQATGGWYTTESGKTYYQDQSTGYRAAIGTKTISGKLYLFDAQGVLPAKENWYTSPDGKTYYVQQDGSLLTGKAQVGGSWYGFGKDGVKTESGWFADGSNWCWTKEDADGVLAQNEICLLSDKTYAIFDKDCYQVVQGWYTAENGKTYYQGKASGYRIATGFFTIENKMYYFSSAGEFFLPEQAGWYTKEEKLYYYREDGSIVRPPVIDSVTTTPSSGNKVKVTVKATFVDSAPADLAYSFDGGASWQSSNSKEFTIGTVISAGKIKIKDKQGYIVVYDKALNLSGTSIGFGIDVSAHQGPIDWSAMAQDGVKFAIIRAVTWSGSSIVEDPYFRTNVRQAKENGILVGAYIYSYAYNYSEMAAEVDKFHVAAQALKAEGYALDMPVFIDYEDPRLYNPDKGGPDMPKDSATRTNIVRYGMDRLKGYGYYPGFYTFLNFATQYLNGRQLMAEGYDFWLAHWDVSTPAWTDAELWQYGTAMVGGREVDANYCYKDYTGLIDGSGSGSHIEVEEMLTVYDLNTNKVVTDTVSNILAQIVANEIGNTMLGGGKQVAATGADAQRAYEVQAVAAHSWIVYQYANNHASEVNPPKVGLKSLSTITNVTYRNLITAAVNKVKDDYITYNGEVALTPYYACSGGKTNSSSDYWGQSLPYLVSVDLGSYEKDLIDRTGLKSYLPISMTRTKERLRADILKVQPKADLSGSLSTWIQPDGKNSAGYYTKVKLGGVETNIDAFYEGVVGPYSLNFTMQVNGEESITFTSYGYGHCVGMSQYAMIQMAALGTKTTAEIATYFFPGTKYTTIK